MSDDATKAALAVIVFIVAAIGFEIVDAIGSML